MKAAAPSLDSWIVPITVAILVALFVVQKRGTRGIGFAFGPVMVIWFLAIAALGIRQIAAQPSVIHAVSPHHALAFCATRPHDAFLVLGAIILCIAGGEALYADMGHFGRKPIAVAWYGLVAPSLLLNYFGQGAFLLGGGKPDPTTFYAMVPHALLVPMIILSAAAIVIASQALISGAYSLTQQAVQLGYSPRVTVVHTSAGHAGQIYVPEVNWALMIACVALVVGFRSSDKLAAAYGLSVIGTMTVTTIAYFVVLRRTWGWPIYKALPICLFFLAIDVTFLIANLRKFFDGGWVPFTLGMGVFLLFSTWIWGRKQLGQKIGAAIVPLDMFVADVAQTKPHRVKGTAVFLTGNPNGVPTILLHHFKHNQVLHETIVLLIIQAEQTPWVKGKNRIEVEELDQGFHRVVAHFGYMETPNVPDLLRFAANAANAGLPIDRDRITYFVGRETLIPCGRGLSRARSWLFALISRNAMSATAYFGIPPNRVVELGMQIEL